MKIQLTTQGSTLPDTLINFKTFMRVSSGDIEDADLTRLILGSVRACESFTRIAITPSTYRVSYQMPYGKAWELATRIVDPDNIYLSVSLRPRPVNTVYSVRVLTKGVYTDPPDHIVDKEEGAIFWDKPLSVGGDRLVVSLRSGYSSGVPDDLILAVKHTAAFMYEHRGMDMPNGLPESAVQLLRGWIVPLGTG